MVKPRINANGYAKLTSCRFITHSRRFAVQHRTTSNRELTRIVQNRTPMVKLLEKNLVFRILGCAMTVHNSIGPGLREKTYENALCVELRRQSIRFSQQSRYPVCYCNEIVDEFVPDLVIDHRVIVDTKTVETIIDEHRATMINYLRITGLKVGVIINFKHSTLIWERLVLDQAGDKTKQTAN